MELEPLVSIYDNSLVSLMSNVNNNHTHFVYMPKKKGLMILSYIAAHK